MVVIGLIGYASGLLRASGEDADALKELYAADAGVAHVKKWLEQGGSHDDIPPIEVNGLKVEMGVTEVETLGASVPPPQPQAIAPELTEGHIGPHHVTLKSVPEGTNLAIFWAFTPPSSTNYPSITVYAGDRTGPKVAEKTLSHLLEGENSIHLPPELLGDAETYVVEFHPGAAISPESTPFSQDSEDCETQAEPHFCLTTPPTDYIVVSKAGDTTVTAYLRQMPDWELEDSVGISYTFSEGEVVTLSWKPYPPDPPDE